MTRQPECTDNQWLTTWLQQAESRDKPCCQACFNTEISCKTQEGLFQELATLLFDHCKCAKVIASPIVMQRFSLACFFNNHIAKFSCMQTHSYTHAHTSFYTIYNVYQYLCVTTMLGSKLAKSLKRSTRRCYINNTSVQFCFSCQHEHRTSHYRCLTGVQVLIVTNSDTGTTRPIVSERCDAVSCQKSEEHLINPTSLWFPPMCTHVNVG